MPGLPPKHGGKSCAGTFAQFRVHLTEENHQTVDESKRGSTMLGRAKNHVIVRALLIAALCMFAFDATGGQVRATIERNKVWNDMIVQFGHLHRDIEILGKFLVDHQTEYAVTEYDIPTFKAIDSAEEELKLAAKDLQKIRSELEYKEEIRVAKR
jgi:hypothetical protein